MTTQTYLTRREAAAFLAGRGLRVSPLTLAKWATTGGGPTYQRFGRRALYTAENLMAWAEAKISAPRTSTSDPA